MPIEAAERFQDKAGRWRRVRNKHPDNVSPEDPELMRDEQGWVYTCACCAKPLRYTDQVHIVPYLSEVGFIAELVGECCAARYSRTVKALRAQLQHEARDVRRRLSKDARRHAL